MLALARREGDVVEPRLHEKLLACLTLLPHLPFDLRDEIALALALRMARIEQRLQPLDVRQRARLSRRQQAEGLLLLAHRLDELRLHLGAQRLIGALGNVSRLACLTQRSCGAAVAAVAVRADAEG